jgi:hypothetical protein
MAPAMNRPPIVNGTSSQNAPDFSSIALRSLRDCAARRDDPVNAAATVGPFKPIYAHFGYDELNYTYMQNGRKLVGELAAMSEAPVYIRTHFMLTRAD